MKWVPVEDVFDGGTREARFLLGRRVRNRRWLKLRIYQSNETIEIQPHTVGILGQTPESNHLGDFLFMCPKDKYMTQNQGLTSQAMPLRSRHEVVVNSPTLRWQFEIEVRG